MKKLALLFGLMLATTTIFAQTKPKSMKQLRDSVFTEMKLSDENKQKMHDLIAEMGKAQKDVKDDAALSDDDKKAKLKDLNKERATKESAILTPEQMQQWKDFAIKMREKQQATKP